MCLEGTMFFGIVGMGLISVAGVTTYSINKFLKKHESRNVKLDEVTVVE